ncbi:MAG: helix-turn-helix transcriptional regulator [Acidaminococcaceae bacterium]|nr:helix-turn-helix transcriptional regulator [Acidaminococcaceae bacterium]
MSVTEQLDKYMQIHKYKISDIARLSGVPYTTIKGLYDKGDENVKLSTLKKLRSLMNCTLDELVGVNSQADLTIEENLFLKQFRELDEINRKSILVTIDALLLSQSAKATAATPEEEETAKSSA